MSILTGSGLETMDYGTPGWNHVYNRNVDLMGGNLLKLRALLDVDLDNIKDRSPFKWNSTTQKWEALRNE